MKTFIYWTLRLTGSAALTGGLLAIYAYLLAGVAAALGLTPWAAFPAGTVLVCWALWVAQRVEYDKAVGWTLKTITETEAYLLDELRTSFSPAARTELELFVAKRGADSDAAMRRIVERLCREGAETQTKGAPK